MLNKLFLCVSLCTLFLTSCSSDDNSIKDNEVNFEKNIIGKWYYYSEEDFDDNNVLVSSFDLRETDCNSGFIILKNKGTLLEEHADIEEGCKKYESNGSWNYDKSGNILTIVEFDTEDGNYIVKGKLLNLDTNELRIKLIQQGDDTDFNDTNTQLVFKK